MVGRSTGIKVTCKGGLSTLGYKSGGIRGMEKSQNEAFIAGEKTGERMVSGKTNNDANLQSVPIRYPRRVVDWDECVCEIY